MFLKQCSTSKCVKPASYTCSNMSRNTVWECFPVSSPLGMLPLLFKEFIHVQELKICESIGLYAKLKVKVCHMACCNKKLFS